MKLYIDPGTGSMLFTVLVAVLGSVIFLLRGFWIKLQVLLGGGRQRASADREPLVIFSEGKRYWHIFEPICEALEKRGQQVLYLTESADDPALEKGYQHIRCQVIGEGNRAFARLNVLKARVEGDALVITQEKREVPVREEPGRGLVRAYRPRTGGYYKIPDAGPGFL